MYKHSQGPMPGAGLPTLPFACHTTAQVMSKWHVGRPCTYSGSNKAQHVYTPHFTYCACVLPPFLCRQGRSYR